MDPLISILHRVKRKLFFQQWIRLSVEGVFFSSVACGLWVVLTRCFPVLGNPLPACIGLLATGFVIATGLAIHRRGDLAHAALEADRRGGLQERLISSWELSGVEGPMVRALHEDARRHLAAVDFEKNFPFSSSRLMRWAFAPVILFLGVYALVPELDLLSFRAKEAEAAARAAATRVKVQRIEKVAEALRKIPADKPDALVEAAKGIERVAEDLRAGQISDKQAFARLAKVETNLDGIRQGLTERGRARRLLDLSLMSGIPDSRAKACRLAAKLQELREKLAQGAVTQDEIEWFETEIADLAKAMGGSESALSEALAGRLEKLRGSLKMKEVKSALAAMEDVEMSVKDLQSVLEQLQKTETAKNDLWEVRQALLEQSKTCRICGKPLKACPVGKDGKPCLLGEDGKACTLGQTVAGVCADCAGFPSAGPGMRGPGRGRGGQVGPLPDDKVTLRPTTLPGRVTREKALLSILQRASPETGAKSSIEAVPDAFVKVEQEAEQALTKEEIPPGSKEFVRQYFGSLEPTGRRKKP